MIFTGTIRTDNGKTITCWSYAALIGTMTMAAVPNFHRVPKQDTDIDFIRNIFKF